MVKQLCSLLLLWILVFPSQGQNMVINPGFEEIWDCPYTMDQSKLIKYWFPFGTADPSPDFFHACARDGFMGVPHNMFGEQAAHGGDAYIGLICYLTSRSGRGWRVPANHREYLMVQLTKPLVAGHEYYGEFWVSLADNCEFSINNIGMYFTRDMPSFDWQAMNFGYYRPQVSSDSKQQLDDHKGWTKISGTFIAKGDELALTIGTFAPDSSLNPKRTKRQFLSTRDKKIPKHLQPMIAYYLIDDIKVTPVDPNESIFPEPILAQQPEVEEHFGPAEIGNRFTLANIYFEFEKATLLRSSLLELQRLEDYLEKNPSIKIQIEGHTDNVGSREFNEKLSEKRAKAVVDYLISKGVNEFRLEYKGHGSKYPIVPNDTPENRALNRRVEFSILEK